MQFDSFFFQLIKFFYLKNKEKINEFCLINEKSKILKLNDYIKKLYINKKYEEIIENLEIYVEKFKIVSYFHYLFD